MIAASFARIFYRNAINIGLPILESAHAASEIQAGDELEVDLSSGTIFNVTANRVYHTDAFPPFLQEMINAGGLLAYLSQSK